MEPKYLLFFLLLIVLFFYFGYSAPQEEKSFEIEINNEKIIITPEIEINFLQAKCRETNQFFANGYACWEKSDNVNCNRILNDAGCCDLQSQCFTFGKCVNSNSLDTPWNYLLCFDGKWDTCFPIDECEKRGDYWCNGEIWVLKRPNSCIGTDIGNDFIIADSDCPSNQVLRGEWDCWENSDHKNCGLKDFERGCCKNNSCFFAGECISNDSLLGDQSEWVCLKGKWDRCLEEQECFQRGSFYCINGFWQDNLPEHCPQN